MGKEKFTFNGIDKPAGAGTSRVVFDGAGYLEGGHRTYLLIWVLCVLW
jgi:hypothetical protein